MTLITNPAVMTNRHDYLAHLAEHGLVLGCLNCEVAADLYWADAAARVEYHQIVDTQTAKVVK